MLSVCDDNNLDAAYVLRPLGSFFAFNYPKMRENLSGLPSAK